MTRAMIDLRSDTVTRPSKEMRKAMLEAEVGDDVFGEDPTVNRLQSMVAEILGKESALFVPSGTMGNQICVKVHTRPGDEIITETGSHIFNYETAGAAFLSSVQVHPVAGQYGVMPIDGIRKAIRPKLYYMPRTALICIENTHNRAGGTIYPYEVIEETSRFAQAGGIRTHLDGARLWHACAVTGTSPSDYAKHFDSVSVCLSKGLGSPVGSVIASNRDFIDEARHIRKILGGGMRQAGVIAAAGIHALNNNRGRLVEDHEKARVLAATLSKLPGLSIDLSSVHTNIVIIDVSKSGKQPSEILSALRAEGVLLSFGNYMGIRAVTHLDVTMDEVTRAATIVQRVLGG